MHWPIFRDVSRGDHGIAHAGSQGELMASGVDWPEVAKLGVAAQTPVMTGLVGLFILRMGTKLEATKHHHTSAGTITH